MDAVSGSFKLLLLKLEIEKATAGPADLSHVQLTIVDLVSVVRWPSVRKLYK